jgi:hypothetical protein
MYLVHKTLNACMQLKMECYSLCFKFPPTGGVNVIKLRTGIFSNPLFCLQKRVVERSNDG